ncbi:hypothetical protein [Rhodococcus qingshengii]|uniref:hypothetical protein n=1 Tax=Rhodococcus qingshengii TaxID=334542 RepID=UPI0007182D4C|nr:hypothetical protein [Rhodococcus qingshengii]MEA1798305.1 hypothetical protein [Rhodococcus qingshengii]
MQLAAIEPWSTISGKFRRTDTMCGSPAAPPVQSMTLRCPESSTTAEAWPSYKLFSATPFEK